jgi:tryptophan 2,3-dioxygenase
VGSEDVTYGSYLRLDRLLSLQEPHVGSHDERTFIVVHQLYELCFSLMLYELEAARDAMFAADAPKAFRSLRRVGVLDGILVAQIDLIETILPQDFLAFRPALATGSGFQSVQFREVEFLCGLKDPAYLDQLTLTPEDRARLQRRLDEPTVWDGFVKLLGMDDATVESVYRDRDRHPWFFSIAEALVDHDEGLARWRAHHVLMVERELGTKQGTGGGGAEYLRGTLVKRFFPELWAVRSIL